MKGFLFLLLTISLLFVIQEAAPHSSVPKDSNQSRRRSYQLLSGQFAPQNVLDKIQTGVLGNKANDTINLSSSATAPALSSLSGGTILLFLMNTLIHLFHLC